MKMARVAVLSIALGAGGIAAYLAGHTKPVVVNAPSAAAPKINTVEILTANGDISVGKSLTAQDISWKPWPSEYVSSGFIRKTGNSMQLEEILGSVARAPFVSGEPIRQAKLIKANGSGYMAATLPPGMRAVSTQISPETGAAGFILPNDRVDVLLTSAQKSPQGEWYRSQTIMRDVRVLAIDQNVEEKSGQKTVIGKIATLELTPGGAEKLALANRLGTISLTLRSLADGGQGKNDDAHIGRGDAITIVRGGQASTQTPAN